MNSQSLLVLLVYDCTPFDGYSTVILLINDSDSNHTFAHSSHKDNLGVMCIRGVLYLKKPHKAVGLGPMHTGASAWPPASCEDDEAGKTGFLLIEIEVHGLGVIHALTTLKVHSKNMIDAECYCYCSDLGKRCTLSLMAPRQLWRQ